MKKEPQMRKNLFNILSFHIKKKTKIQYRNPNFDLSDQSYTEYSRFNKSQKLNRQLRISKGRIPKYNKMHKTYKPQYQLYESSSEQDIQFMESPLPQFDSSEYDNSAR